MKLTKSFAILACAGLLSAGVFGSVRHAYAQDTDDIDQSGGGWSAPDATSATAATPDAKKHPLDIGGCWDGTVNDAADGEGDAFFDFEVTTNGKDIKGKGDSALELNWSDDRVAGSPIKGKVGPNGFKFSGPVSKDCKVSGSGTGSTSEMTGKVKFEGKCKKTFRDVTFSIEPGPCQCL
jgi:hypothetical protein